MNKFKIDGYVENIATNKNIRNFHPIAVSKSLHLPLRDIVDRLNELVKMDYLELRFEIRCDKDLDVLEIVDDYSKYLETEMYCEDCDDYIEITLYNIFPVYYIKPEYREYIKKNIQDLQTVSICKENCLTVNENAGNVPELIRGYINEENINKKVPSLESKDSLTIIIQSMDITNNEKSDVSEKKSEENENKVKNKLFKYICNTVNGLKTFLEVKALINTQFPGLNPYLQNMFDKFIN